MQQTTINQRFIQALPGDNPYLSPEYIDVLKETFEHRPELLQAYLYGSWDSIEAPNQIIRSEWLMAASKRPRPVITLKRFIAADTARFGDDETVIYLMMDADIEAKVIMPHCRSVEISNRIAQISLHNGNLLAIIESIGSDVGAAVIDELNQMKIETIQFNPAGEALRKDKYYNLRAEAWDMAAHALACGILCQTSNQTISIPHLYQTLHTQLCIPTYSFRNGKFLVEAKEDIKKRLGRSPDHADCYVIALWGWHKIRRMYDPKDTEESYEAIAERYAWPI